MTLETLLTHPSVEALGRALLHFLWQGSLLALTLWVVKTITPISAARVRYAAAGFIMLMMPVALLVTLSQEFRNESPVSASAVNRGAIAQAPSESTGALIAAVPADGPESRLPGGMVCIWALGVLLLSLRATGGWMRAQRLKRRVLAAKTGLEDMMTRLKRRLDVSAPVRLCASAMVQVPTVIGWIRPCILLPVTTITGLSESQLEAILAHELAHIRRHDYLVNLLQTAIETVLFYHPAVWWVGRQMRIEREHCCDDIAVAVCGNAIEYAGALAELEQIRGRTPEPALAATGGELLARIRRLLGRQPSGDLGSRSLGAAAAALVLAVLIAGAPAVAQQPAFTVTSVKPDVSGAPGPQYSMGPTFTVKRATLKDLVKLAYFVEDFRILGGPGWINSARYNIEAKAEGNPSMDQKGREAWLTLQQQRLQTLLQDRFGLAVHRETRELPIYTLTVAKGGLKLEEGSCIAAHPSNPAAGPAPGKTRMDYCGYGGMANGLVEGTTMRMADLTRNFSAILGRHVMNNTGVTGTFRVHLTFTPDDSMQQLGGPPAAADGPTIFTAVQEQLGLKLDSGKGPVDVLVIDRVEKPSGN
jgi:uncharacterized protein (TIGR03435 family)